MFVVYKVKTGKTISVYTRESSAKSRVTKNNREHLMQLLKNNGERLFFSWNRKDEWAYCSYTDYAPIFYEFHKKNPGIF